MNRYSELAQDVTAPDGTVYKGTLAFVDLLYNGEVKFHKVENQEAGRLDIIAYTWYRDPSLYWIIALMNNIKDPLKEVVTGMNLAIPITPLNRDSIRAFTYPGTK